MSDDQVYKRSIEIIRKNIENGQPFDIACEAISVADENLRRSIIDDALKIEIAERHYGKNIPLIELSKKLQVSMERLLKANDEMLEDVMDNIRQTFKDFPIDPDSLTH
ncbi:MAG: hypothetical protein N2257_06675 [Thermodesulfovibrionales bacterium]|nr:hypothetical protein [Thermodesulfovibrionales bacterium]